MHLQKQDSGINAERGQLCPCILGDAYKNGGVAMKELKASEVMVKSVISAKRNASARDLALQLLTGYFSGIPVTDEQGKIIGVITEIDLLEAVKEGKELARTTAEEIMTRDVITADVNTAVSDLVKTMKENNIIRLPITNQGKLVGIVARCDILKGLLEPEFAYTLSYV